MSADRLKPALDIDVPACAWILRFDVEGRADPGASADIGALGAEGTFLWLHLDRADARLRDLVERIDCLTVEARDALAGSVDHQFVEHVDGVLCGAIVDHQQTIDGVGSDVDFLRFALGRGFLLTSRRSPLYSTEAVRRALAAGSKTPTPEALFEMIVTHVCDCSARMLRDVAVIFDKIEENVVIEGRGRDQRAGLGRARRKTIRLTRQVNGIQSTMHRLEETAEAQQLEELGDIAASLAQRSDSLCRDAANLQDRSRILQEEINAVLALETNDRLYLLTTLTAILLPATLVTGYFGMNTKQLLFSENDNGTLYATLLCIAASAAAMIIMRALGITEAGSARRRLKD